MNNNICSLLQMCFNFHHELSSTRKPHRPLFVSNCQRCVTVCGYRKHSNKNILCTTCYHRIPSAFMRTSYKFINNHYTTKIDHKPTNCYNCLRDLTTVTRLSDCHLCSQSRATFYSLDKFYHEHE